MFESLTEKLTAALKKMRGVGLITETQLDSTLHEIKLALLEADVNYHVVKEFVDKIKTQAVGEKILETLTAPQQIQKIVHDEILSLLGATTSTLDLSGNSPHVIMLIGLQGSGKTTTIAKLAKYLKGQGRHPYLVPADVYRPAAIEQLHVLAKQIEIPVYPTRPGDNPVKISKKGVDEAVQIGCDVVLIDTAGRLHIDVPLMDELKNIKAKVEPKEVLLVADAMTGQDAVNVAKEFMGQVGLTGVILTKLDGDARGGAALSIRFVTNAPIKFASFGEKLDDFELFHPDRMASRILDMGDLLTLVEKAQNAFDEREGEALEKRIRKSEFTLGDFLIQLKNIKKLGSLESIMKMIPGMGGMMKKVKQMNPPESELKRTEAIIYSMTISEREDYKLLDGSRRRRIALGSGTSVADVNKLINSFREMQKMMKNFSKMGMKGLKLPFGL